MATETSKKTFIAALDIGTTTIRCYIFDQDAKIVGAAKCQVISRVIYKINSKIYS